MRYQDPAPRFRDRRGREARNGPQFRSSVSSCATRAVPGTFAREGGATIPGNRSAPGTATNDAVDQELTTSQHGVLVPTPHTKYRLERCTLDALARIAAQISAVKGGAWVTTVDVIRWL